MGMAVAIAIRNNNRASFSRLIGGWEGLPPRQVAIDYWVDWAHLEVG